MLDTFKELIANQFEAAFCTLSACIDRCPETAWNAPVANHAFCQAVFHALFYADVYLGPDDKSFREQPFHRSHAEFFGDYEELEDRPPQSLYDKESIKTYLEFCRSKAAEAIAAETADTLKARSGFGWLAFSRAELYVYNIRHLQHHAAQLILRLRIDGHADMPWARSGWRDM
jgi:hypothetical protein